MLTTYTDRSAFTIAEFCARNRISEPTYYKLRAQGLGPKEMRLGLAIRVTAHAERDWQMARENPQGEEAAAVARKGEMLRRRAIRAVSGAR